MMYNHCKWQYICESTEQLKELWKPYHPSCKLIDTSKLQSCPSTKMSNLLQEFPIIVDKFGKYIIKVKVALLKIHQRLEICTKLLRVHDSTRTVNGIINYKVDYYYLRIHMVSKSFLLLHISLAASALPIVDIVRSAHGVGAKVFIDACQSVPHMAVGVQSMNADFLVASSHKVRFF